MFLCLKSTEGPVIPAARLAAAAGLAAIPCLDGLVGQPLDARRHQAAGGYGAFGLRALAGGDELDADGLHLLLEVEVGFVGDALGLQRVAEGAQAVQADALALRHVVRHHARQLAQDGHHVGVGDGAHLAQPLGHFLHGDAEFLVVDFLVEAHS